MGGGNPLRRRTIFLLSVAACWLLIWFMLPDPLFNDPCSTVLLDRRGNLLGARIAPDHQWRFPETGSVPEKFASAIIHYEDRLFRIHPGFNPVAMVRAAWLNLSAGRVVSGGSTITMQVIRLARKNRSRTFAEKLVETVLAYRLELTSTKEEILRLYASHAPFGGNVVGLEAAAWRYFGTTPGNLSWAEAATLAVLPNSPGLIYPGRNPQYLLAKRNRLLDLLFAHGVIDVTTCTLAKSERLPGKPFPLPRHAPHLLDRAIANGHRGRKITSTIDLVLQQRIGDIFDIRMPGLNANGIWNAAVIVADVRSGEVLALKNATSVQAADVDVSAAPRSTGSILKPLLYAAMLSDGLILPNTLVPDIPTQIGGFVPENYNLTYDGAVPAGQALARSLNIPAVKMLQNYGYDQFYAVLKRLGMTTLHRPAGHYGLSLILGGAEATLWDMTAIYARLAGQLEKGNRQQGIGNRHAEDDYCLLPNAYCLPGLRYSSGSDKERPGHGLPAASPVLSSAALWQTFEAMVEVVRPGDELMWRQFSSSGRIAWKTGTSFGNRDAWAIGITPGYVVGVWVGNASGEGRPALTGIGAAAPILFDVFRSLPAAGWFQQPDSGMLKVACCRQSGHRASTLCPETDSVWIPAAGAKSPACPYHQLVHLDRSGQWQVNSTCESPENMQHLSWFILPPVQEWYFRPKNPFYKVLPPFRADCSPGTGRRNMEFIYPKDKSVIYIPTELDGRPGKAVFRAAHRDPSAVIYWMLDESFAGTTSKNHQMALAPGKGKHRLTLTDGNGERVSVEIEVISDR